MNLLRPFCLRLISLSCLIYLGCAQSTNAQTLGDSLRQVLKIDTSLSAKEKAKTQLKLGSYLYFNKDKKSAIELIQQVIQSANQRHDLKYSSKGHAQLSFLYHIQGDSVLAKKHLDTARIKASKSEDKVTRAYLEYALGWSKARSGQNQLATKHFLNALRKLEGIEEYEIRQGIYSELAAIYSSWNDLENFKHYAKLTLDAAKKNNTPDQLTQSWQELGSYYEAKYRSKSQNQVFLDSAMLCYKKSYRIGEKNWDRLIFKNQQPFTANNIAVLYLAFFDKAYKDSVQKYVNIAIELGQKTEQHSVEACGYGILSEYAIADGDYNQAIHYLNTAYEGLIHVPLANKFTLSQICMSLSLCYEKKGDFKKALHYQKEYMDYYQAIFDARKMKISKNLEAKYQAQLKEKQLLQAKFKAEKQKQHLITLQQQIAYEKKLKTIYIVLAIAALLSVIILYYAYKQRSKTLRQKVQLHALEVNKIRQEHQISLLSAVLEGQEKERGRLARDLHDGLGGLLSGIKIEFSEIQSLLKQEKLRKLTHRTLGRLDDAVDELRRIAHSLMPEMLLKYGLAEATHEFCKKLNVVNHTKIVPQIINYTGKMDKNRQMALYRIMQELVNNAIKHAKAKTILVQLQETDSSISLVVEDDGVGMQKSDFNSLRGGGLENIKARVGLLEGEIEMTSNLGAGTTIAIECKLT